LLHERGGVRVAFGFAPRDLGELGPEFRTIAGSGRVAAVTLYLLRTGYKDENDLDPTGSRPVLERPLGLRLGDVLA
jgi:hypothetical protein